jgi:hypothetical protein
MMNNFVSIDSVLGVPMSTYNMYHSSCRVCGMRSFQVEATEESLTCYITEIKMVLTLTCKYIKLEPSRLHNRHPSHH